MTEIVITNRLTGGFGTGEMLLPDMCSLNTWGEKGGFVRIHGNQEDTRQYVRKNFRWQRKEIIKENNGQYVKKNDKQQDKESIKSVIK